MLIAFLIIFPVACGGDNDNTDDYRTKDLQGTWNFLYSNSDGGGQFELTFDNNGNLIGVSLPPDSDDEIVDFGGALVVNGIGAVFKQHTNYRIGERNRFTRSNRAHGFQFFRKFCIFQPDCGKRPGNGTGERTTVYFYDERRLIAARQAPPFRVSLESHPTAAMKSNPGCLTPQTAPESRGIDDARQPGPSQVVSFVLCFNNLSQARLLF